MNTVIVVITSILIYSMLSPLIDKILQTINTYLEVLMAKNSLRITKYNKDIRLIQKSLEEEPRRPMVVGFGSHNNEEE